MGKPKKKNETKDYSIAVEDIGFKVSEHYHTDNIGRENAIRGIGGDGRVIAMFYVERGHQNGPEFHYITTNAIIIIVNAITNVLCTKLIARPNQLTRYGSMGLKNELNDTTKRMRNWVVPKSIVALAISHQKSGLNYS